MATLSPTARSTVQRGKDRATTDRATLHAVLDAGIICHFGYVRDGAPVVIPTSYGRDGDTLYVHGSTGARSLRTAIGGGQVCVTVTLLDGVVYARSVFHHSANYRSAVVHGEARQLTDDAERLHALRVLVEHVAPGSWDYARKPNPKELAATAVLALDLTEAAVKIRTGPPVDEDLDVQADQVWAGVLPVTSAWAAPQTCQLTAHEPPEHVRARRW